MDEVNYIKVEGDTYVKTDVILDGKHFFKCVFVECRLVYSGGPPPNFSHCQFSKSHFYFDGPAGNTVAVLKALSNPKSGLRRVFEDIFRDENVG
jgi:hypothetical protein